MQDPILPRLLHDLMRDLSQPEILWQVAALISAIVMAYGLAECVRKRLNAYCRMRNAAVRFGADGLEKALFPCLGWLIMSGIEFVLNPLMKTSLLNLARVPLFGISLIYIALYLMRRMLSHDGHLRGLAYLLEKTITVLVWAGMVLNVMGIEDDVLHWMSSIEFYVATVHFNLLSLCNGLLWVMITLIVALWAGRTIDERLLRADLLDANLQVVLSRIGRALLILSAVLISLSIVGIDITVLGVFGGALGVGLGFGLQKIASNYVSGFIILLDRSLRLGDTICVGGLQGRVTQIRTRYTVMRGLDGVETLVPNEKLITDIVQNQSSFLTRGLTKVSVQVEYGTDIHLAMHVLVQATQGVERVLQDPAPCPYFAGFGSDGINLELGFWISEAALGIASVRSAVNYNIWVSFAANGIRIPSAQHEVRILNTTEIESMPATITKAKKST
ncbi:mechanosensitive ion channel family protein [Candidatus Vallotia lariciata]|uniref:mechanosensitive ion channel family protein n=1 Tax=Candidatus Vallotia laricis TaxID=2018052 RepID=UPI001D030857|nr:mechanosensitive ion channel domain-containing protein [Candidatus Vallotia lariciata]UDG82881.1 mechanosensitive ion channel-like protein [Candidatus Vallotia lariciata]